MKRKTLTLLSVLLLVATLTFADNVPINIAEQVAKNYYAEKSGLKTTNIIFEEVTTVKEDGQNSYYIFNLEKGFIIISAEDNFTPVLGYSLNNNFGTENQPENLKYWMQNYTDQITYVKENNIQADAKIANKWKTYKSEDFIPKAKSTKGVAPLVDHIHWNQDGGWNNLCPEDDAGPGGHVYAGCVATAMSIIMYYWQYPLQGVGSYSYYHGSYATQTANFGETEYLFSNMDDNQPTNASALLMSHCGIAVRMDYSADGSGAYSPDVANGDVSYDYNLNAVNEHFGYEEAEYVSKSSYTTADWITLLKEQLDAGYPIYYSGRSDDGGHAFVCSGYNDSDEFHYNFGWSGSGNGFYPLTDVGGFHNNQAAVINFYPTSDDYNLENVGYVNQPVQNFTAEAVQEPTDFFTVEMEWDEPTTKALTGYDVYRGTEIIESDLPIGTTSYTDESLVNGVVDYYAVRAKYDDGIAQTASELVEGVYAVKFWAKDPDTGSKINGVNITFHNETKTTGFAGALFSLVPFAHDYEFSAEKTDYPTTEGTIECVYQTEEFDIIMGEGITNVVDITKDINLYPNPSKGGIFNIENLANNSHIIVFDITGKAVYQAQTVNTNNAVIDLSYLTKGVYQMQINSTDKKITKSIIIQ